MGSSRLKTGSRKNGQDEPSTASRPVTEFVRKYENGQVKCGKRNGTVRDPSRPFSSIKKKMNERVEKKALTLFNERMMLENEKKSQQDFHTMSSTYETSNFQSSNLSFSTVPMAKPPHFDGTDYAC